MLSCLPIFILSSKKLRLDDRTLNLHPYSKKTMNQWSVFTGVFADEIGQRFLRILSHACDLTFNELHAHSMPSNPKRYRGCLDRVSTWDTTLVANECSHIEDTFPDVHDVFKGIFISYVRAMRGQAKNLRIKLQIPKFVTFLRLYFTNLAVHKSLRDGKYFEIGPLEQRIILMDSTRDSLFQFLGDDYVRLEDKTVVDIKPTLMKSYTEQTEHSESNYVDDIQPDDSVSSVDFAERQNKELRKIAAMNTVDEKSDNSSTSLSSMTISQMTIQNSPHYQTHRVGSQLRSRRAETETSAVSERSRPRREESTVSVSERSKSEVSSVSERPKHRREESEVSVSEHSKYDRGESESSAVSERSKNRRDDTLSEISMQSDLMVDRKPYKKSPVKSYVTSLTEDADTYN